MDKSFMKQQRFSFRKNESWVGLQQFCFAFARGWTGVC